MGNNLTQAAIHEAGHVVVLWLHGIEVVSASIQSNEDSYGRVDWDHPIMGSTPGSFSRGEERGVAAALLLGTLSGWAAEWTYSFGWLGPEFRTETGEPDAELAAMYARVVSLEEPDRVAERGWCTVAGMLASPHVWTAIRLVARQLLQHKLLQEEVLKQVLQWASEAVSPDAELLGAWQERLEFVADGTSCSFALPEG